MILLIIWKSIYGIQYIADLTITFNKNKYFENLKNIIILGWIWKNYYEIKIYSLRDAVHTDG